MDRVLLNYLPTYLHSYNELKEIFKVEEPELEDLYIELKKVLSNQFIQVAGEYGIKRFESLLNIIPKGSDTLEVRRARVLLNWFKDIPYTYEKLKELLDTIFGEDTYVMGLENEIYFLDVLIKLTFKDLYNEVFEFLREVVPCNLTLNVSVDYNKYGLYKPFMYKELRKFTHKELREKEIKVMEYLNKYNCYKGFTYEDLKTITNGVLRRKGTWFNE
ncbi:MAG: putative phage tail protein [Lachnospirales bacterium]